MFTYNNLLDKIKNKLQRDIIFDDIKNELDIKNVNNVNVYNIKIKHDDNVAIIYSDGSKIGDKINGTYLFNISDLKEICHYDSILYNDNGLAHIGTNYVVQKCYEGTYLVVFYHTNKWYVTTRRCLDAYKSFWIKNYSYGDFFSETIKDKFNLDNLDKDYCYHFILVHHLNKQIIDYSYEFGIDYRELIHIDTIRKYVDQCEIIDYNIANTVRIKNLFFNDLKDVKLSLMNMNNDDEICRHIKHVGYIVKSVVNNNRFIVNLQTRLYQKLKRCKPNTSNKCLSYLELYKKNDLEFYLTYVDDVNMSTVIFNTHLVFNTLVNEALKLYFLTRNKKNEVLYKSLGHNYKQILFDIHGLYINMSKKMQYTNKETHVKINYSVIYKYLKQLNSVDTYYLLSERLALINN